MTILPKYNKTFVKSFSVFVTFLFALTLFVSKSFAASAYISPATGLINKSSFKVSVYVESSTTEPQMASANIKINYPSSVKVVSINDGDFDSYVEKTFDETTKLISISATNNAGNYKSGQVKVASINFEAIDTTGQVQLAIATNSAITGAGGEQLLTETINGGYTLSLPQETTPTTTPIPDPVVTPNPVVSTTPQSTSSSVPVTGGNDFMLYLIVSLGLIGLGFASYKTNIFSKG